MTQYLHHMYFIQAKTIKKKQILIDNISQKDVLMLLLGAFPELENTVRIDIDSNRSI